MKRLTFLLLLVVVASLEVRAEWFENGCFYCRSRGLNTECFETVDDGQTGQTRCWEERGLLYYRCFTEGTACMNVIVIGGGGGGGGSAGGGGSSCTVSGAGFCPTSCFYCSRPLF